MPTVVLSATDRIAQISRQIILSRKAKESTNAWISTLSAKQSEAVINCKAAKSTEDQNHWIDQSRRIHAELGRAYMALEETNRRMIMLDDTLMEVASELAYEAEDRFFKVEEDL